MDIRALPEEYSDDDDDNDNDKNGQGYCNDDWKWHVVIKVLL